MNNLKSLIMLAIGGALTVTPVLAAEDPAQQLIAKYVGNYEKDALLADPRIAPQLVRMMGPKVATLKLYLNVAGQIDYYGGGLTVSGNAPQGGLERMAVICVLPNGPNGKPAVETALYDMGKVTVYSSQPKYDYTSQCIKDWIGLANTKFAARMTQPTNVQLISK